MQFTSNGLHHTLSTVMVFQSDEYARFKMINGNRDLNERKIRRIMRDIDDGIDVLKFYPINVVENGKRLEIVDGQHRFYICKKLKKPVYYIVMERAIDLAGIAKVNSNTEKWKTRDFINCYVQQGNKNYIKLREFIDTYGFSPTVSIKLLSTGSPGTESGLDGRKGDFERGKFEVKFPTEAVRLAECILLFSFFKYYRERGFIIAIHRILQAEKISIEELLQKCQKYTEMLDKRSGYKDYLFMLENVMNRGKQIRMVIY